jgi:Arc/MetJ-type ribon-helix-helix transcriptional regulator
MEIMNKDDQAGKPYQVEVEFNQQQEAILRQLVNEGRYGKDYGEVIRSAFQEFLRQTRL